MPNLALSLLLVVIGAPAEDALQDLRGQLPSPGTPLVAPSLRSLTVSGSPEFVESKLGPDPDSPYGESLTIVVKKAGENAYTVQAQTSPSQSDVKKGDVLLIAYRVRCPEGGRETGEGVWNVFTQRNGPPWDGPGWSSASAGRGWKQIFSALVADKDYPKGELQVALHVATQPQTLVFGSFVWLNMGANVPISKLPFQRLQWAGSEPNAPWRKKAEAMIRTHRMGPLSLRIVDGRGRPVQNASIELKQLQSEYPFGSFTDYVPGRDTPDTPTYKQWFKRLFNRATVPIYWADWGWEYENNRNEWFRIHDWCVAEGLPMKAHCLLWPSMRWSPTRLQPLLTKPNELRTAIFASMDERIRALRKYPYVNIDVLNELKTEQEFEKIVGESLYLESFRRSKAAWPKAAQVYNDYAVFEGGGLDRSAQQIWERKVDQLVKLKAPVTMLGWQGHFGETPTAPERVWQMLDGYWARWKLPFEITEFDINTRDEQGQAAYTRDLMTAWFAHPATRGFTNWGFWEGQMWMPNGAMLRKDWTVKPNGKVWMELTQKTWRTNAKTQSTRSGNATVRAFYGTYEVTVRHAGKAVKRIVRFTRGSPTIPITL
jgi:endo-1,4-beta-xylanase